MMKPKAAAIQRIADKLDILQAQVEELIGVTNGKVERAERDKREIQNILVRCRDVIEDLWRDLPTRETERKQDVAIFLNGLSIVIGDGPTPHTTVEDQVKEISKHWKKTK